MSGARSGSSAWKRVRLTVVAASVSCLAFICLSAHAADNAASASSQSCLACHGADGMEKALADGGKLSLHIDGEIFGKSVHQGFGCTGCHSDVDLNSHPPQAGVEIKSARDFRLKSVEICRTCHADKFEDWEKSVHAAMVRDNNPAAPVCTDCHNPHAVITAAAANIETIPCQNCHKDIYQAYLTSVHAKARLKPETSYAPVCSGCHTAHSIRPVVSSEGPKVACLGCHVDVLEKHKAWLPNAALHFDIVSCPACHSPTSQRKVDLMIYDNQARAQVQVQEGRGVPVFESRVAAVDKSEDHLDAIALWRLVTALDREDKATDITLRGRLEVATGPGAHRLAAASEAIHDCATCHEHGSHAFQNVTISIAGPDGRRIRRPVSPGVLTSAISTASIGGFYALGATRVGLLDALLILAFLGGLTFWVGHLTIRWLYKRYSLNR
jgi:hypothetical protein